MNIPRFYCSGKTFYKLHSRNNNFLLMRLLAAIAVAVSHSSYFFFPSLLPHYFHLLSDNSVYVFFLISGFLITKSAQRRSVGQFLINRINGVYPALILNLITISFMFAPLVSFWKSRIRKSRRRHRHPRTRLAKDWALRG